MTRDSASAHSLDIDEDMPFQRRNWAAERVSWIVMALVVAAGLLGAFAEGPLSWATAADEAGALRVEYGRLQRNGAPTTIKLSISQPAADTAALLVSEAFTETMEITGIRPEPDRSVATANGMLLHFRTGPQGPVAIYLYVKPAALGFARPSLRLADGAPVHLPLFVYP